MSTLRVQLPWQRSGPGVATTRRHSRVNAAIFLQQQQQQDESVEDEDSDQQIQLEVPRVVHRRTGSHQRQEEGDHHHHSERLAREGGGGERRVGGQQEEGGDLDVMSATSTALGQVAPSSSSSSQRERRAQIDSCWCNIPELFVDPASRVAYYWMALVTVAVVYNWIVIVLRVAFEDMRDSEFHQRAFYVLDTISDVIYLADVAIQSRTAYLEDGCLVKSLPETVRHYRSQTYFALDVLSVVPLTTVLSYLSTTPSLRMLRLLKYPSMTRFFEKTDSRTNTPNFLRAFRLSLHLWMVIHWIGCFYYLLSQYEGLGTNDWVYPNAPEYSTFSRKYIFCMYWSTMTLTTIGERPWPVTDVEYIFTGVTFLIGVFVFAAVVGNVGDVISNMNAARHDFQARMDQIKFYMNHRNIPEHLQDQIKRWAEYTWARTKAIDEHSVLQLLPSRLRTEVAIHVHLKTLKKVRIFEQCEEGLLRELVLKLRPSIYSPGEYICRIGEIGREMYIIDHGKVEILFPEHGSGQMKQVAIMTPGNYFGEISLLKLDEGQNKRTADVRSIGFSELLCLSRRDLMSALMEYPAAKRILEAQARQRMEQTKRVPNELDPDSLPMQPGHPNSTSGPGFGSGRRSARAIFAQVMKQEGFSKLLASTANEELSEMKNILKELREIKNQICQARAMQQELQGTGELGEQQERDEGLRQIRTQLLMHTGALIHPSTHTSPSTSTLTNPADLSSEASTLTSPTVAQLVPLKSPRETATWVKASCRRKLPSPVKSSPQRTSPDCRAVLRGMVSEQTKPSAKALSPFGCSVPIQNTVGPVTLPPTGTGHPEAGTLNTRRRRSTSGRVPKAVDKDQLDNADRAAEGAPDSSTLLAVVQGGGGDEPAVVAVEKDPSMKEQDDEKVEGVCVKRNASNTDSCKETMSDTISLGSAFGSRSIYEFLSPSSEVSGEGQLGSKPTGLGVSSELLRPLSQSDSFKSLDSGSNTSSYTSTSYSTTSSSSGGRGHSPKPAKPRPRYRRDPPPDKRSYDIEGNSDRLEETARKALQARNNAVVCLSDKENLNLERCVSSDGFSVVSVCSSVESTDSVKPSSVKTCSGSSLGYCAAADPKCVSLEYNNNKRSEESLQMNAEIDRSEDIVNMVKVGVVQETKSSGDLPSEYAVGSLGKPQEVCRYSRSIQEQLSSMGEKDHKEETSLFLDSVPANKTDSDTTKSKTADKLKKTVCRPVGTDRQEDSSGSEDSDADCRGNFIAATRVKSDFDKRISQQELTELPRRISGRKTDDTQPSILLVRHREMNDCLDCTEKRSSLSPDKRRRESPHSEHSHSVHAVIGNEIATRCEQQPTESAQNNLVHCDRKFLSSNASDSIGNHQASENHKPSSKLPGPRFSSENESKYTNVENTEMQALSLDKRRQPISAFHDEVYNETLLIEHMNCPEKDAPQTAVYFSKESQRKRNDKLGISDKQHPQKVEYGNDRSGSKFISTATGLVKSEAKEKNRYPVSILKKCGPETRTDIQYGCNYSGMVESSERSDVNGKFLGTATPAPSCGDGRYNPPMSGDVRCYFDTDSPAENGMESGVKQRVDESCMEIGIKQKADEGQANGISSSAILDPRTVCHVTKDKTLKVADSAFSSIVNGNQTSPSRGHNSSLALSYVGFTGTNKVNHPESNIVSKRATGNSAILTTEKCKVIEPTGDSALACGPSRLCAETNDEANGETRFSLPLGFAPSPPQRRKTLKRRGLTKLAPNTHSTGDRACKEKAHGSDVDVGADSSSPKNTNGREEKTMAAQETQAEDVITCITLVKNLVWQSDPDKKPSSTGPSKETGFSAAAVESPLSLQVQENVDCKSGFAEHNQQRAMQQSCVSQGNSVDRSSSSLMDSKHSVKSNEAGYSRGFCVKGVMSSSSFHKEVPNSTTALPGSDIVTNAQKKVSSVSKNPSFTEKITEEADCFRSGETLDKANNSAVICSFSMSSTGADAEHPDSPVIEHVSFEAPSDVSLVTSASSSSTLPTFDHLSTERHTNSVEGVDDALKTRTVMKNRNQPVSGGHDSVSAYCGMTAPQTKPEVRMSERDRESNHDAPARHENGFHKVRGEEGRSDKERSDTACPQNRYGLDGCDTNTIIVDTQHGVSSRTRLLDTELSSLAEVRSAMHENRQHPAPAETTPGWENHRHPDSEQNQAPSSSPPQEAPQERQVPESLDVGGSSSTTQGLQLQPHLLDSPGACSMDDSTGEAERDERAESVDSFIFLADFGVTEDEEDDEGALSDLSGCDEHSDLNSDLDDL